ncbi:MAG: hypothetical protein K5770_12475 [Lachnospiraceae bacterium]|nr:hypothetical protein [Lachnospiraceae bacterium]
MKGYYNIRELTISIMDEYQLKIDEKTKDKRDYTKDPYYRNYYQRVYRALKDLGLLDKGVKAMDPQTKRQCRYYSEAQKQAILADEALYNYVRNTSSSEKIKNSLRFKDIERIRNVRRNALLRSAASENARDEDAIDFDDEAFQAYKNNMMLKALFEYFFTPIDEELLKHDYYNDTILKNEWMLERMDIEAEDRLKHPEGSYYERRGRRSEA